MRLLLTSDLHYKLPHFDWVLSVADQYDVVVLAGDHLDITSGAALESQWVVVLRYLERLAERTTVIASSGNHDLTTRNEHGEKVASWLADARSVGAFVDGDTLEHLGVQITVCPWWDGPATRRDFEAFLRDAARHRLPQWLWVYHPPPARSPTAQGSRREYGDADLRNWIEDLGPDAVLTGHVHEAPFVTAGSWCDRVGRTWVFNAGRLAVGRVPNHVTIDFDARRATWSGGGASANLALDQ